MITEDYVSFETAKLLNEKGMNKSCFKHYVQKNNNDGTSEAVTVCTLQMAMKWLREVHKIIPIILTGEYSQKPLYYWFRIDTIIEGKLKDAIYREDEKEYSSYEEACEAAIKYCLENLI